VSLAPAPEAEARIVVKYLNVQDIYSYFVQKFKVSRPDLQQNLILLNASCVRNDYFARNWFAVCKSLH
jgi:hypothetical protein